MAYLSAENAVGAPHYGRLLNHPSIDLVKELAHRRIIDDSIGRRSAISMSYGPGVADLDRRTLFEVGAPTLGPSACSLTDGLGQGVGMIVPGDCLPGSVLRPIRRIIASPRDGFTVTGRVMDNASIRF